MTLPTPGSRSGSAGMTPLRFRQAVRALILDPADHVLLVRFVFPSGVEAWALPGGGLEDGESHDVGLRRELREEIGLTGFEIGPHIWNREHVFPMSSGHDGQRDRIHLVRAERFEPEPAIGWDAMRAEYVHEIRWWTLAEIDAHRHLRFTPRSLAELLARLLSDGAPTSPIEVDA